MKKLTAIIGIIVALFWTGYALWPHTNSAALLEAWVLDVGQGESVLVREPSGKTILFDGGPDDKVLSELGAALPAWEHHIDLVILSHPHVDHLRGLIAVLDRYTVDAIWSSGSTAASSEYQAWMTAVSEKHIPLSFHHAPERVSFGAITLTIEHPWEDMTGKQPAQAHDADLAVKLTSGPRTLFLTGDLNEEHEQEMLTKCQLPCSLKSDVLQIPHHGSASGLTPEFLAATHPDAAVIPVGLANKFHHPREEILDRLKNAHIPVLRTDTGKRIHIVLLPEKIDLSDDEASVSHAEPSAAPP